MGNQRFARLPDPFTGKDTLVVKGFNPVSPSFTSSEPTGPETGSSGGHDQQQMGGPGGKESDPFVRRDVDTEVIMSSPT